MIQATSIWLDGKLVPFAQAQVHVTAFTLHYGIGAFEGLRCYRRQDGRSAIFRLREHIERLYESVAVCSMTIPFAPSEIEAACVETVRANRLEEGYIRPLVFTGAGVLGMGARENPIQTAIIAFPWSDVLGADAAARGIRAQVSTFVRAPVNSMDEQGQDHRAIRRVRAGQARVSAAGLRRGDHARRRGAGGRGQRGEHLHWSGRASC
jgi:branched-chain amino acid aminotransferase